jgi:hypothetical protein
MEFAEIHRVRRVAAAVQARQRGGPSTEPTLHPSAQEEPGVLSAAPDVPAGTASAAMVAIRMKFRVTGSALGEYGSPVTDLKLATINLAIGPVDVPPQIAALLIGHPVVVVLAVPGAVVAVAPGRWRAFLRRLILRLDMGALAPVASVCYRRREQGARTERHE